MHTRETLLKSRYHKVEVEHFDEPLYLRFLPYKEVQVVDVLMTANDGKPSDDLAPLVAVKCLVDENGDRLFSDADTDTVAEHIDVLRLGSILKAVLEMHKVAAKPAEGDPLGK